LCRNPDYMEVFKLAIPYGYAQDRPWRWIPASLRVSRVTCIFVCNDEGKAGVYFD
jgi:hypothetical protein